MSKQNHRAQDESLDLILMAVKSTPAGLTRTEIARALKRTKTPHLIDLIESLVEQDYLKREVKIFDNGVEGYIYTAHDSRK